MKHLKSLLVAALLTLGVSATNAQKVAHIDFESLVASMPETVKMQADLEKLGKTYGEEIQSAQKALKAKVDKYTAEEVSQTQAQNEARIKEVQTDQAKLQQLQQAAQQEIAEKRNAILDPIVKKAQEAINAVAKSKGIAYVLDSKALIVKEGDDLLKAVQTKLGITATK
ncbi:OmpH family outer membrane protein [Flavicella sediminum]|uniref:OmpH family outer membrane protein n=1 Tax=Flavicella sediminum TaxID=2585141 RepID=UPI00111D9FDF|nr:OmpH family outer membrane protein [Flavicella sediminum]